MIAHLRGTLIETDIAHGTKGGSISHAVIDVSGVGYLVFVTDNTATALQENAQTQAELFIETHIREDHIHLFGFLNRADRAAFRILATVQGVGSKVAMAILQVMDAATLQTATLAQDSAAFTQAAGVGNKLASRIVSELKDKHWPTDLAQNSSHKSPPESSPANTPEMAANAPLTVIRNDSLSALVNLGYDKTQAYQAVAQILHDISTESAEKSETFSTAECIRLALQKLAAA